MIKVVIGDERRAYVVIVVIIVTGAERGAHVVTVVIGPERLADVVIGAK